MTQAIIHHLGPVIDMAMPSTQSKSCDLVTVHIVKYNDDAPEYCRDEVTYRKGSDGQPKKFANLSLMLSNICNHDPRNAHIAMIIKNVLVHTPTRKVLVLSDRKHQLRAISTFLEEANISNGFYWGGCKPSDIENVRLKQVICATFPYASEGMDIPELDTLVLASPKSDVVQSCGRILRGGSGTGGGQNAPVIWDVVDTFCGVFLAQARKRQRFYKSQHFLIETRNNITECHGDVSLFI
jgi:ERCC4-related helicase